MLDVEAPTTRRTITATNGRVYVRGIWLGAEETHGHGWYLRGKTDVVAPEIPKCAGDAGRRPRRLDLLVIMMRKAFVGWI